MKRSLLLAGFVLYCSFSYSQYREDYTSLVFIESKFMTIMSVKFPITFGDFSQTHAVGAGAGFGAYAKLNDNMRLGLSFSERYFFGKKIANTDQRFNGENFLSLTTRLIVRNNSSTIIAGIEAGINHISADGFSETSPLVGVSVGVPILGKLPLLGTLFRTKNHTAGEAELMVFITPRIIQDTEE